MDEAPDRPSDRRAVARRSRLGIAISLIALAGCAWWASRQQAPELPDSPAAIATLAGALGVYAVSIALRGLRWSTILHRAGIRVSPAEPYALTVVGYMGNTVLPLRGGEVLRVVLLRERSDAGWAGSVGSIIPERLLDVCALAALLAAVMLSGVVITPGGTATAVIAISLVALAVLGAVAYRRLRRRGHFQRFAERISPFVRASKLLFTPMGLALGLLSVGIWLLEGVVFYLVAASLDLPVNLIEGVGLAVTVTAFSLIPSGPAYAGTYDAAMIVALEALGITGGVALGYVLLARFVIFVPVTVTGLILVIARYGGLSRLRSRASGHDAAELAASPTSPTA